MFEVPAAAPENADENLRSTTPFQVGSERGEVGDNEACRLIESDENNDHEALGRLEEPFQKGVRDRMRETFAFQDEAELPRGSNRVGTGMSWHF